MPVSLTHIPCILIGYWTREWLPQISDPTERTKTREALRLEIEKRFAEAPLPAPPAFQQWRNDERYPTTAADITEIQRLDVLLNQSFAPSPAWENELSSLATTALHTVHQPLSLGPPITSDCHYVDNVWQRTHFFSILEGNGPLILRVTITTGGGAQKTVYAPIHLLIKYRYTPPVQEGLPTKRIFELP